jgi:hypothetical protein
VQALSRRSDAYVDPVARDVQVFGTRAAGRVDQRPQSVAARKRADLGHRIDQAGGGLVVRHRQGRRESSITRVSQRRFDSCEVERLPKSEIDGDARHIMDLQDFRDARPERAVHRNDHRRFRREQRHARRLDGCRRGAGDEDDAVPFARA